MVAKCEADAPASLAGIGGADREIQIGLLTGGGDRHYAFGLATALVARNVDVDFIAGDELDSPEMHSTPGLRFFNLRRNGARRRSLWRKACGIVAYYGRLIRYAAGSRASIFHVLWNNKFEHFDRTMLMLYYKMLGKRVVLTAHNVNAGVRDGCDTALNRLTLRVQYRLANHIFVHTEQMKAELVAQFGVGTASVTVIPYGINNAVPDTALTPAQARASLGIAPAEKTVLFFGNIVPYKGLEYLIEAAERLASKGQQIRLIVAGRVKRGDERYWNALREAISAGPLGETAILRIGYIPDEDIERYFKAADVLALPYKHIFQSGVLFLGYSFGVPAIVSDVGSLREDVVEGETGFVCQPGDAESLARALESYFSSELYSRLDRGRQEIRRYARERHSWQDVGTLTRRVYAGLLSGPAAQRTRKKRRSAGAAG